MILLFLLAPPFWRAPGPGYFLWNLDFPAGPAYYMMGFEIDFFTPIFVMARTTGWSAHIMEQTADNRIIRPLSEYVGKEQRKVVPLSERH